MLWDILNTTKLIAFYRFGWFAVKLFGYDFLF